MAHQEIKLHGGPWHGREIALQNGLNHFHIVGADPKELMSAIDSATEPGVAEVPTKQGTYSRVGDSNDFEWDGWNK